MKVRVVKKQEIDRQKRDRDFTDSEISYMYGLMRKHSLKAIQEAEKLKRTVQANLQNNSCNFV